MYEPHPLLNPGEPIVVRNPYTKNVMGRVACATRADVEQAISLASSYSRGIPARDRAAILRRAGELLEQEATSFALRITEEAGTCLKESRKEVDRAVGNLLVASEEAVRGHGEALRLSTVSGEKMAITLHEPVGVVAAITPFNRPLNQVVVKVAPAIAADNAIVVKPSEKTPLTCLAFADLMRRAGLPEALLQVVVGEAQTVANMLIDSPEIGMVSFTGSIRVGREVAARAGMKRLLLELGGNDPLFVLEDADLGAAARVAADGAIATAGQACRGIKRIFVHEAIADAFVEQLRARVSEKRCGDPFDPDIDVGCLIDEKAAELAERRCRAAVKAGAKLVCGGLRAGALFQPTVLDCVPPGVELVSMETFAPVAPVIRFSNLEAAIELSNGTEYGLQAGVMTHDYNKFLTLATQLRVGAVNLMDGPQFDSPYIPFGGVKASGLGREGIRYAMREMSTVKTLVMPWTNSG
jgi:putative phosphonoacetaldehyde dehydrogenase